MLMKLLSSKKPAAHVGPLRSISILEPTNPVKSKIISPHLTELGTGFFIMTVHIPSFWPVVVTCRGNGRQRVLSRSLA